MSRSLTPQNPLTTNTISVSSTAGFSAGDLVYQKSGDFGVIPDGIVTSANFNVTSTVRNAGLNPNTSQLISVTGTVGGGAGLGFPNAAKLTNGNMVVVYCSMSNATYYFRVIDENGAEVVAETSVGATAYNQIYGPICVTALTGGGFVVAIGQSSGYLAYIIYSNTGTVVTGLTTDSSVSVSNASFTIASRPDGSFIIAITDTTSAQVRFKVYSAIGVQVIAWTNVVAYWQSYARVSVAVRSDNSFVVSCFTTSTNIQYYVYTSAGASTTNASLNSATGNAEGSYVRLDSTTLTNDTIIFTYNDVSTNAYFKSLNTSNVLSNLGVFDTAYSSNVKALASGGYIISYSDPSYSFYRYLIKNSAGTSVSSGLLYGVGAVIGRANTNYSVVQMASNIAVINTSGYSGTSTAANSNYMTMFQIVTATNAVRNFSTASMITGLVSSSVNAYARGGSTPNAAAFLASTGTTLTKTISRLASGASSMVLTPTVVETTACNFVFTRVMQNGQIVVVYSPSGTNPTIKFAVYSSAGVFQATYTVGTAITSSIAKCCVLTNGNLVITYAATSQTLTFAIYSPSFVLLSTATQGDVTTGRSYGHDISPMTGSRFVLGYYTNGNVPTWAVYNSSASQLATSTISSSYDGGIAVGGTSGGGFVVNGFNTSSSNAVFWYTNTSGSSFTQIYNTSYGGTSLNGQAPSISVSPNGQVYTYNPHNSSAGQGFMVDYGNNQGIGPANGSSGQSLGTFASTILTDGSMAVVILDTSASTSWCQITPALPVPFTNSAIYTSGINVSAQTPIGPSSNPCVSVAALYDNQFVVVYRNTSSFPIIFIGSSLAGTYTTTTVAGTTVSTPAYYPSQSNGYIFKGVATTTVPASGSGVVQNVGAAQLNSQYPAGTTYQAFDSTGTLIQGTKGTITGRNVNMTGTS